MIIQTSELDCGLDERLACVPSILVKRMSRLLACGSSASRQIDRMVWTFGATLLVALALAMLAAIGLWAHLLYWVKRLTLPLEYSVEEVLRTKDGAPIEIPPRPAPGRRGGAAGPAADPAGPRARREPQETRTSTPITRSLATLATLGRDVWLLTLLRSGRLLTRAERRSVRFSAMVRYDLPRSHRGDPGAHRRPFAGLASASPWGACPLCGAWPERRRRSGPPRRHRRLAWPAHHAGAPHALPAGPAAAGRPAPPHGTQAPRSRRSGCRRRSDHAVANPRNVPSGVTRLALVNCIEDILAALNADFAAWMASDGEIRDGERVLDGLAPVGAPALFIAGSADRDSPLPARGVRRMGATARRTPKRFLVLGRDFGAREDYGHGDLAVGAYTGVELFEPIARFLGPDPGMPKTRQGSRRALWRWRPSRRVSRHPTRPPRCRSPGRLTPVEVDRARVEVR